MNSALRTIDSVPVITDEPTLAPMRDKAGKPIFWQQTRTLCLADGRTVYGCAHCEYTSENVLSIRPHLNVHKARPTTPTGDDDPVAALVARLAEYDRVAAERDEWKRRAKAAERDLRAIRKAIGGVQS
ncbi:hypothetical protein [Saccharopolyspora sp. 6V]|uniref:hypothetical protein n=1 Tax=Saccharopolyspora sp. 6V TaxID=2877239 RepID=UPI001CD243E8|nr:hypothetical protein [Saccharopolyspora sp. 6V]MCA1195107.1 hypothetical protein [Saccharopolyspora sp. 6V]